MGHDLWHVQIPIDEKIVRTVAVYAGLAILLRLAGKRDLAQLNTFDLLVMLLLSNVVQNAIIGNDNSLAGGLIGAAVLVVLNNLVVRLVNRHRKLIRLFEGPELVIVENGQPKVSMIRRLGLRVADVRLALRRQGASDLSDVARATLEPGGALVVTLRDDAQPATRADLRALREELLRELRALGEGSQGPDGGADASPTAGYAASLCSDRSVDPTGRTRVETCPGGSNITNVSRTGGLGLKSDPLGPALDLPASVCAGELSLRHAA